MKLMNRDAALQDLLEKHVFTEWLHDLALIENNFLTRQQAIEEELIAALESLCKLATFQHEQGRKGDIRYIYISLLRTRVMRNKAVYRIDAYDENWFLDEAECAVEWSADFVFEPLFNRMAKLEKLKSDYARKVTTMDIEQIQQIEAVKYHLLTVEFLKSQMPAFIATPSLERMPKADTCTIFAGEYRDDSQLLCCFTRRGEAEKREGESSWIISS
ncbi:hypothetical protein B4V02_06865 [Paenibacillus kribbensis]|uniref:Uncharacterized protein n=1 Tax=Paenibacillus kribbensis TaxID=172713 RepID=A0A222WIZ4_9BACL|nr:hypothetical protein [Paenibacillus kribbensis]ASR46419.1 hypothetical protein B4V02_06865 [Paenibacillus kribbensis]